MEIRYEGNMSGKGYSKKASSMTLLEYLENS
jgi:hypothetical protein